MLCESSGTRSERELAASHYREGTPDRIPKSCASVRSAGCSWFGGPRMVVTRTVMVPLNHIAKRTLRESVIQ
jgi:hypothetical protein